MKHRGMRDLRGDARQTNVRLIAGALVLLFLVGDGLIYILYGRAAALTGLLCIIAGMLPIIIVVLILFLLDLISRRANPQ